MARTYPHDVAGLVMVDAATPLVEDVVNPEKLANWDATNRATSAQVREGVEMAAQDLLASALGAEHITSTNSGHHIYLYSPALVVDAIRELVDDVRELVGELRRSGRPALLPVAKDAP